MEKSTIWLDPELHDKVETIKSQERRQSWSNTVAALLGEAVDAREERAKREQKSP